MSIVYTNAMADCSSELLSSDIIPWRLASTLGSQGSIRRKAWWITETCANMHLLFSHKPRAKHDMELRLYPTHLPHWHQYQQRKNGSLIEWDNAAAIYTTVK